jgi:hypothetical protein
VDGPYRGEKSDATKISNIFRLFTMDPPIVDGFLNFRDELLHRTEGQVSGKVHSSGAD